VLPGQQQGGGVGWIGERNERYQKRFSELLLVSKPDLQVGWQLAHDLGQPVAPLLWAMVRDEKSNVDRRLVLLAAAVVAGGPGEDERLFRYLDQQKPMLEERCLLCMMLALGPRRARLPEDFWRRCLGPSRTPEQLLAIAARLAAARFPGSEAAAPVTMEDDPGLMAAAAFAGLPISAPLVERRWRQHDRHVELFWRGALLGENWRLDVDGTKVTLVDESAAVLARLEDPFAEARAAAMLLRAHAGLLDGAARRPDWRLLQLASGYAQSRAALQRWLPVRPLPRDERPDRIAVAFALLQPLDRVLATRAEWGVVEAIRAPMAVALAWRLLREGSAEPIELHAPDLPEWAFVLWASGGRSEAAREPADPALAALLRAIRAGRAERDAVRDALEEALWRWGCHPGVGVWEQERLLVRDLMLSGSNLGGGMYVPHIRADRRYFPTGLDRNDKFFDVAVPLYEFLLAPRPPVPRQHRLP